MLKTSCLPILLLCLLGLFRAPAAEPDFLPRNWKLVFADEFRDSKLDAGKWRRIEYETSYSRASDIPDWRRYQSQDAELVECNRSARNGHRADAAHLPQAEGLLTLWGKQGPQFNSAIKEAGFLGRNESTYACGGITSEKTFAFQYGYVEVRARFDSAAGVWPAIWMKPLDNTAWPRNGEIDIMEHLNHDAVVYQTLHYLSNDGKRKVSGKGVSSREWSRGGKDGWHTYGMLWEKGSISFYVDGKKIGTLSAEGSTNWPFDKRGNRFYLIIDQQVGGSWVLGSLPGKRMDNLADAPAAFDIDYVRVYSTSANKHRPRKTEAGKRR